MKITGMVAAGSLMVMASLAPSADAQSIAQRVASVRDGKVRMTFASRPDLCGWGNGISTKRSFENGSTRTWSDDRNEDVTFDDECNSGPVRLVITRSGGQIEQIKATVGGRWRANSQATDIGHVSAREATNYLFSVATSGARAAEKAIFPTTLADSVNIIQPLYDIARNESREKDVRDQAVFWLSQQPEDRALICSRTFSRAREPRTFVTRRSLACHSIEAGRVFQYFARMPKTNGNPMIFAAKQSSGSASEKEPSVSIICAGCTHVSKVRI